MLESSVLLLNWEGEFGAGIQCAFAKLGGHVDKNKITKLISKT